MANNFGNVAGDIVVSKYLDLAGLTSFWGKIKGYVDGADANVLAAAGAYTDKKDKDLRDFLNTLEVNGKGFTYTEGQNATSLEITVDGADILVGKSDASGASNDYEASTIAQAIDAIDDRLDAAEAALGGNVINDIEVVDLPTGADAPNYVDAKVEFSGDAGKGQRKATITINETALDTKISGIDDKLLELEANAGVAGIRFIDTDPSGSTKNLVKVTTETLAVNDKSETTVDGSDGNTYDKSLVTVTIDESGLEERLDANDTLVAAEIADRKEDIANLAGDGYIVADGATTGAWKKTNGTDYDVKYRDITALSDRLATIDDSVVTKVTVVDESTDKAKYVTLSSSATDGEGAGNITLTFNDSALESYIANNEDNLAALTPTVGADTDAGKNLLTVNGHAIIKSQSTEGAQISMSGHSITLDTTDLNRPGSAGGKQLEETLSDYDKKFAALTAATQFAGVVEWNPETVTIVANGTDDAGVDSYVINGTGLETAPVMQNGDIVIVNGTESGVAWNKEYILDGNSLKFVELGDTVDEVRRITALENWVDNNIISTGEIEGLGWTVPTYSLLS